MDKLGVGIQGRGWLAGEHIGARVNNLKTKVGAVCNRAKEGAREETDELDGLSSRR